jgi:D,D-heptose 1,7-bisphosphate phosphatase
VLRQAVIMVGEFGARFANANGTTPKSAINVERRPFLDMLIDEIARYNTLDEILLLADMDDERIQARYGEAVRRRPRLIVAREQEPLGTAGALLRAAGLLQNRFLLLPGDSYFDFNLLDLVCRAGSHLVHTALRDDVPGTRFGRVVLDGNLVRAFVAPGHCASGPINARVYVVDRSILAAVDGLAASLEQDVFPRLAKGGAVSGTCYPGDFIGVTDDPSRAMIELREKLTRPAVFFDRDGVLNHDTGFLFEASKLKWIDGAREAIKAVNDAGYFAFVVSNQSGVARGYFAESDVLALHRWMADDMAAMGAHIDAFEYCPDHPEGNVERYRRVSDRRKPAPGMIMDLLRRFAVDTDNSILIGDRDDDIKAAHAAGLRGHLFPGGNLEIFVKRYLRPRSANVA